jgi:hypothetical protein
MPGLSGASAAVTRVCRLPDPTPPHGYAATREAATAAFAKGKPDVAVLGFVKKGRGMDQRPARGASGCARIHYLLINQFGYPATRTWLGPNATRTNFLKPPPGADFH